MRRFCRRLSISDATFVKLRELKCRIVLEVASGTEPRRLGRVDRLMSFDDVISYLIHLYEEIYGDGPVCRVEPLLDPGRTAEG